MKNILKITLPLFIMGFIFIGAETANAQWNRQNRREVRREYREDLREARRDYQRRVRQGNYRKAVREYREDVRDARRERRVNRRGSTYNNRRVYSPYGSRYYYYNGRLIRRW